MPAMVRLSGDLNVDSLRLTLNEVVRRHESLRTHFVTQDGLAVQEIEPSMKMAFPLIDLSVLEVDEREQRLQAELRTQASEPFDLSSGPLIRGALIRLDETEHVVS
ncbi:condensation domain-containing protein, partial [Caballeronia sp. dw_276]|uniref:condensation domain-containing protein n=1 Tax=Caballeronia sp. dw_276 TaxID=2719795 RepID=UPI003211AEDD